MIFLDKCETKVVTGEFDAGAIGKEIKCIVPLESTATVKAKSNYGEDHAVGGDYANAGFARFPGDTIYGGFSKVDVTVGTCYVYYTNISERL